MDTSSSSSSQSTPDGPGSEVASGRATSDGDAGSQKRRKATATMSVKAHLVELRNRTLWAALSILLGTVAGWFLYDFVFAALSAPLKDFENAQVNFSTVTAAFDFKIKISIYVGVMLSSPIWLYQLGAFVLPGLTSGEKRHLIGFVCAGVPMFLGGCVAAYMALPVLVHLFLEITPEGASNIIQMQDYLSFVTQIIVALGFACVIPLVLVALNFAGVLSAAVMLRGWRWMVVLSFLFGALVTPTADVISMFLLAAPLLVLFALAVGVSWLNDRRRARKRAAMEAEWDESEISPL